MSTQSLHTHLKQGVTTVARTWAITRADGLTLGFTDHDLPLTFDGITFEAEAGLTARAIAQTTGLAVDNTEAMGALIDDRISEADINAGLYDGAQVRSWLVNWDNVDDRKLLFQGTVGEIRRKDHMFEAELRGLSEQLNRPLGRVYQKPCGAVLGDAACRVNTNAAAFHAIRPIVDIRGRQQFIFENMDDFAADWFTRGRLRVTSGAGSSLLGWIKSDTIEGNQRRMELWQPLRADIRPGDTAKIEVGCDKRATTCREKFNNIINFQGFPFLPGNDWLSSVPRKDGVNNGTSLQ